MRYRAAAISTLRSALRRAARSRRGEGDVNGARCSTLLLAPIPLSSRRWNKKKALYANSMGVACAIALHSSRVLFFSSPFSLSFFFFFSLPIGGSASFAFSRSRRFARRVAGSFAEAGLHREYNVVGLMSLANVEPLLLKKRRILGD